MKDVHKPAAFSLDKRIYVRNYGSLVNVIPFDPPRAAPINNNLRIYMWRARIYFGGRERPGHLKAITPPPAEGPGAADPTDGNEV